ncbi:MAG: ftsA [Alphaproteobacteria bacterium]|nr:ftsA [Alphaproteobacteria bacterium]
MVKARNGIIAALDIGSSKVCCFIARVEGNNQLRVVGIGHQPSSGIKGGNIVDMEAAEHALSSAVNAAEQMCGERVEEVIVGVGGGYPASHTFGVEVAIGGHEVADKDIRRVLSQVHLPAETSDRDLIHTMPIGYSIDGRGGVRDPRGMYGERLGVDVHLVTAASGAMRNLGICVKRSHLEIADRCVTSFAAGLASLVQDEMDLGVTLIDMGGGTTSIAVFYDGNLIYTDSIPVGGNHVTHDIARGLSTPVADAERMKILYGRSTNKPNDEYEIIDVPLIGEQEHTEPNHVPRSVLVGIIRPRIEETFELVRGRLEASGVDKLTGRRIVLTGGASQLDGIAQSAAQILNKQVRNGRPVRVTGLAEATGGPAFSACAGLLTYALRAQSTGTAPTVPGETEASRFGRLGSWLRENF